MMRIFDHDGLSLSYRDEGAGPVLVFQHGLGANAGQPFEIIGGFEGFRRITLECRGHGGSDMGSADQLAIATFAEDVLALMDHLGIARAHVGGISMGAAVATRFAVLNPLRAQSLCIARPAWFDRPSPDNMAIFAVAAAFLDAHGAQEARARFEACEPFAALKAVSPDNAASLLGQFDRPDPASTQVLLSRLAVDGTGLSMADYHALRLPVQVIGHGQDAVHPWAMAQAIADAIPGAELVEITAKSISLERYRAEFSCALEGFLRRVEAGEGAGSTRARGAAYG
jgi:pimeloyl-ACP methyl ester carboxylesterase